MFKKIRNSKLFPLGLSSGRGQNSKFKIQNFLEYGIYAFVFLLPWQIKLILRSVELNRGVWDYGTIALYGTDILLAGLLIVFAIQYFYGRNRKVLINSDEDVKASEVIDPSRRAQDDKKEELFKRGLFRFARKDKVTWVILSVLDLFIFISIFFAQDKILALYRYAIILLGLGLFWLIVKAEYNKAKLAIAFFSGLAIQGIIAVQQFLMQSTFSSKWFGMAAHNPANLGVSVVETRGADGVAERWLRAYGSLDHPNILGGLMAIGLIILVNVIINHQRTSDKKTDWKFIIHHLAFSIMVVGLIFSFSRSALFAFAIGLAIFFIYYLIKREWFSVKKISGVIILFVFLFGMVFVNYQSLFITRAAGTARLETNSSFERKMYLNDSFALLKKDWLFGTGVGNYTKALSETNLQRPWYYLQPVHNVFLLVWNELGIFGLLSYLAFLGYLFWRAIKGNSVLGLSVLAVLAIIMVFDHYLWSLHFGVLFFFGLTGFLFKDISSKT